MMLKLISLTLLISPLIFGMDESPSEFKVKCMGIMQPLLQDIAAKKAKIDQCDNIIQSGEKRLTEVQGKCDQLQIKLAVSEAVVRAKDRQLLDQHDLYTSYKNNSLVKDELLKAYRVQVASSEETIKAKSDQIELLLREAKDREEELSNCKSKLDTLDKSMEETNEAQIQKETAIQLKNQAIELRSKSEQLQELQAAKQWQAIKIDELTANLTDREQQLATLQVENQKLSEQLSTYKSQVETISTQLEVKNTALNDKQVQIDQMQRDLDLSNCNLSECKRNIDMLQATNCFWFGNTSDIQRIQAPGIISPFDVLCDSQLAGQGWTVVQRRIDGSENFYRNWTDYRNGFGSLHGEFFIGLEKLYRMTTASTYELYVHIETFDNRTFYARYAEFSIGSEEEAYVMKSLGAYTGTAGNSLNYNRNRKFSTFDADNDHDDENCAELKHGGWWYDRCGHSNLNGEYMTTTSKYDKGIYWYGVDPYSLKAVQMMVRPQSVQFC